MTRNHVRVAGLLLLWAALPACVGGPPTVVRDERMKMGTRFSIQVATDDRTAALAAVAAAYDEIDRVEALLSEWKADSEISQLNRHAGRGARGVGADLFDVLARALRISEQTAGAFDVTFAACGELWSFTQARIPSQVEIDDCIERVDYRRVELEAAGRSVRLPAGMRLGIAGIGKGYGVDRAAEVIERHGFRDYIVDGGGDIRLSGSNAGRPWSVGIADPRRAGELLGSLALTAGGIVTSGDYMNYFEVDGRRYHHILDPRTGRPARGAVAATVIAPTATEADALATALCVLGPGRGLQLLDTLPQTEALIIDSGLQVHRSAGFPELIN